MTECNAGYALFWSRPNHQIENRERFRLIYGAQSQDLWADALELTFHIDNNPGRFISVDQSSFIPAKLNGNKIKRVFIPCGQL